MECQCNGNGIIYSVPYQFYLSTAAKVRPILKTGGWSSWNLTYTFRDLTDLACNIAIGLSAIDWVGVPLALIWYQLPEVLSSVECSTNAEPFSRFLATQLHLAIIYENHKNSILMPSPSAAFKKFHSLAGHERRHFHGRSSDLRRMMNVSGQNDWKMVKHIRKVVSDGGLESLATFKNAGGQQEQDQNPFSRSFHSLGRTLFLSLAESGKSIPVDFCLSLLDQIIKQGINHNNNSIEHIIQACSEFKKPKPTRFRKNSASATPLHFCLF